MSRLARTVATYKHPWDCRQNRRWLAMRAPSANAWNFVQITVGCTSVR